MPTYNGSAFLPEALFSVIRQGHEGVEVIAVDDGSTDDTLSVLESYRDRLHLEIVEQPRVGNWVAGTNVGLRKASGKFATILHQDDLWMPGRLDVVRGVLDRHDEPINVIHPIWFLDENGRQVGKWRAPLPKGRLLQPDEVTRHLLVQNSVAIPGTVFPLAAADQGMDEELWYTADWDLWLGVTGRVPTVYVPKLLAAVRLHSGSITSTQTAEMEAFRHQHEVVLERHLSRWQADAGSKSRVRSSAEFSIELNVALAALAHKKDAHLGKLAGRFMRLGPAGWWRYMRDSRIVERAAARLRAGLGPQQAGDDSDPS
jgi:glycosyltransferase involved in cell wall biosynthesis